MKKKSIRVVQKLVEKGVRNFTTYLATSAFQDSGLAFDLEATPLFPMHFRGGPVFLTQSPESLSPTGGLVGQLYV